MAERPAKFKIKGETIMTLLKARTLLAVPMVAALCARPAAASSSMHFAPDLKPARISATQPESVVVNFHNANVQERELQIGDQRFCIPSQGKLRLRVTVGAPVRLYSAVNSKLKGPTLLVVAPADAQREVLIY